MLLLLHPNIIVHVENVVSLFSSPPLAHKKYESVAAINFSQAMCGQLVSSSLLDRILVRCCWKVMLLSLHPNFIVHVENVVSLFSSPSTSSQKVRKCSQLVSSSLLDRIFVNFYYCFSGVAHICRDAAGK